MTIVALLMQHQQDTIQQQQAAHLQRAVTDAEQLAC